MIILFTQILVLESVIIEKWYFSSWLVIIKRFQIWVFILRSSQFGTVPQLLNSSSHRNWISWVKFVIVLVWDAWCIGGAYTKTITNLSHEIQLLTWPTIAMCLGESKNWRVSKHEKWKGWLSLKILKQN